jgi:hypothetical protein
LLPLVRYFSARYARAFLEKGEVLFRSLSYFRDYEDDGVRADEHEGTLVHLPSDGLKVTLVRTGETVSLPHRLESSAKEDDIFVYCMSTELSPEIAKRFNADVAVEIREPVRFLGKLRSALSMRKRLRAENFMHDKVRYYNWHEPPIVDWALPERIAMRKPAAFAWQSEYRFVVPVGDAFRVENVDVSLVPVDSKRAVRATSHPHFFVRLGSLASICRVHKF